MVYKDLSFYCERIEHQSIDRKEYLNVGGAIACILQLGDRSFFVRIQVFDWGIREGINKSQEWADIASRKKVIA
ncbi:hypothetical protein QUB33_28690, partial [Microcoleus sp. B3-A4]|uniref:hypothetical protein n=1 Tax=Microcoleus sp. B3-A4 TaxID=2818653 RepID=UPI002FD02604